MSKIIDISSKLTTEKPQIKIGEKLYCINNGIDTVLKFEELATQGSKGLIEAIKLAISEESAKEINLESISIKNFKVLTVAIMAAMQDLEYEEAEARFQQFGETNTK